MTLFKDFIRTEKIQNITEKSEKSGSEKKTATFPIPQNVYIGVAVATIGTTATVASVVTLSCAKEFQVKGSTKIKKKKRAKNKGEAMNNNAEINKGFEGDDDVKPISCKNRSTSLAPHVEKYEHMSTGEPSRNAADREKELLQKEKVRSINVAEMEISSVKKSRTSSGSAENRKRKTSIQTVTLANTNQSKPPSPRHEISLVSSMIHDLQREDTIIQKTVKSVTQGSGEGNSCVEQSRIQRQITSTSVSVSIIKPPQDESDEKTACCFQWKPSLSTNKVKKSTKTEEDPKKFDLEKNGTEVENEDKAEKVSFLKRVKRKLTWRNALVVICPCFSYYILEKGNAKNPPLENEKDKSEKDHREIRDRRFERDMQMSQAFCVLLSQLLFLAGADARDNKIGCAVVAIAMNYLSLVTLGWLIVQALYLFSFTRRRESETKQKLKTNLYYAGAWGLPLFAVVILASKYDSYNKHPHCWISFSDSLSWSVATPMITLGLVQIILVILLVKALITYRKSGNADEKEDKKNVIKSGLRTVVCITITVIVTWLLGSLSLNIDRDVYHMFFTIFNALQGFAFFLFYVVLNPQVRQLLVAAWEWKESSATPFDEHEAIEVEEDKEKDKKKGKGKSKAANDKKSQDRKPEDLCTVNTVQNVAEARMAAASIVKNSKGKNNKENVTLVKFGEKKETGKASLASKPSGSVPAKKLPPITQQKNKTPSNQSRGKTVLPYTVKAPVRKTNDFPSSPKGNHLRSPSPGGHQSQALLYQNKKTEQSDRELKDNVPVAAFSSPPHHGVRPRSSQQKLRPITPEPSKSPRLKPKNQKQAGKKNIAKGNKT